MLVFRGICLLSLAFASKRHLYVVIIGLLYSNFMNIASFRIQGDSIIKKNPQEVDELRSV